VFAEDSVAECVPATRWDGPTRARHCGSMPAVRASAVAAAARWVAGPRPRTAGWRSGVPGRLRVSVGEVASPEELAKLVRVTSSS
jgi:hypothetical protein